MNFLAIQMKMKTKRKRITVKLEPELIASSDTRKHKEIKEQQKLKENEEGIEPVQSNRGN
jgi:hypothetical protein